MKKQININTKLILILLLGFFLRIYKFRQVFNWSMEQSIAAWPIIKLFEEKKLTLIGIHILNFKSALFRAPFYTYIFAPILYLFNFNPLSLGFAFILIGLCNILLIYLGAKNIFNKKTALFASFLYSSSFAIINFDKNTWVVTPMLFVSSAIIFFLSKISQKKLVLFNYLIIGGLAGLGFSFHFQSAVIFLSLLFVFKQSKKYSAKKLTYFILGAVLLLMPLIIFNLRHNFIMLQGLKNTFFTNNVVIKASQTLFGKINYSIYTFNQLAFSIFSLDYLEKPPFPINFVTFALIIIAPALIINKENSFKQKVFFKYFYSAVFLSIPGLTAVNQGLYQSSFYLWFLIPLFLIIWSNLFIKLFKKRKQLLYLSYIVFLILNLGLILKQKNGSYLRKIKPINYILKNAPKKNFSIKFIGTDYLSYDYLLYFRAPYYQIDFNNINLQEQWHQGKTDIYFIQGKYDWKKDKYQVKPYKKSAFFNSTKVFIK